MTKPCLILTQCFPPHAGGIEILMHGLADALANADHAVHVLADQGHDPDWAGFDAKQAFGVERFGGWKVLRRRQKARAATQWLAAHPGAHVFTCSYKSLELMPQRALDGAQVACLVHGMELPENPKRKKVARITRAFGKADVLIANSRFTAGQTAPYVPDGVRLEVVNPPIPPQPEADPAEKERLRAQLGPGPVLASVSRLEPRKGVDQVIRAAAALQAEFPGLVYAVGGGGEDRERLEALAHELSAPVTFLGRVSDAEKAALLELADLFTMPVRREGNSVEGFGISYLEAAWYGTPAIAGQDGGAPDAVLDGQTGLVVDGTDTGAVTQAIRHLLSDAHLYTAMAAAAQTRAQGMVWENRIGSYLL